MFVDSICFPVEILFNRHPRYVCYLGSKEAVQWSVPISVKFHFLCTHLTTTLPAIEQKVFDAFHLYIDLLKLLK